MTSRFTIRHKLLLASLTLLVIPWLGYQYVIDMSSYLLKSQEQALLDRTRLVATVLNEKTSLLQYTVDASEQLAEQHLYVRALKTPITVDGYADDWSAYTQRTLKLGPDNVIKHQGNGEPSINAQYLIGSHHNHLYLLFTVHDDQIVYSQANVSPQFSDHMQLAITSPSGEIRHFLIATFAPGKISTRPLYANGRLGNAREAEHLIEAEWQEIANGYNIELRIPLAILGTRIGFTIADVDNRQQPSISTLIGTLNKEHHAALSSLIVPSPEVETLLRNLETASSRTWVVDKTHRVIARTGELNSRPDLIDDTHDKEGELLNKPLSRLLLNIVLSQPSIRFDDELSDASILSGETVSSALRGEPLTHWRHVPDQKLTILTASYPLLDQHNHVIGAIVIEETSNASLMVQNRAMEIVINLSAATFAIATIILFAFATRLSFRIRRLRNDADAAIASDGRVLTQLTPTQASDEIGDLSRSFSNMIERLSHYNRYLETMAGKLSHELRTPITVLRSSLENLDANELSQNNAVYVERAKDGITRLDLIVSRMSEATRLEQTLQTEHKHAFDLIKLVTSCISGYKLAYPNSAFTFESKVDSAFINGSSDLIAQLLDKLVNNAKDFALPDTNITFSIKRADHVIHLSIFNQGPHLPPGMRSNLFNSMVSLREKRGAEPHLGLGLYIAKLICEFHNADIVATNKHAPNGVEFTITFPAIFDHNS